MLLYSSMASLMTSILSSRALSFLSSWAENALSWAVAEGLLKGYPNGQLCPRGNATRAEAAAILVRYAGI